MYVRFELNAKQIAGRLNLRALRIFSETSGRPLTTAIAELGEWWNDEDKSLKDIPFSPADLVSAAHALANSNRSLENPPDFDTVEETMDAAAVISLVQGFANSLTENAELYAENPILGPIMSQISALVKEAGTAVESAATGLNFGQSDPDSESPEHSTSPPSSGTESPTSSQL